LYITDLVFVTFENYKVNNSAFGIACTYKFGDYYNARSSIIFKVKGFEVKILVSGGGKLEEVLFK
jgi:hypothetical protein